MNGSKSATSTALPRIRADNVTCNGVLAAIDEGLGTSFRVSARKQQDALIVSWSFLRQTITGIAPIPGQGPADFDIVAMKLPQILKRSPVSVVASRHTVRFL